MESAYKTKLRSPASDNIFNSKEKNFFLLKMKLNAFLLAAVFADKKHPEPLNHPEYRINELKEHVTFIFE